MPFKAAPTHIAYIWEYPLPWDFLKSEVQCNNWKHSSGMKYGLSPGLQFSDRKKSYLSFLVIKYRIRKLKSEKE